MGDWVTQSDYPVLIASDVTKQSFGKTVTGYIPWIEGVQYVRARGRFNPDGSFGISGAMTYPDAEKARVAANGLGSVSQSFLLMGYLKFVGLDPLVRSLKVTSADKDVQFASVLSERDMRKLVGMLSSWIGNGMPAPPQQQPQDKGTPGTTI
jgi:hypothetical protein